MCLLSDGKGKKDFWTSDGVKTKKKKKGSKGAGGFWTSDNSLLVETDPEEGAKRVDRQSNGGHLLVTPVSSQEVTATPATTTSLTFLTPPTIDADYAQYISHGKSLTLPQSP